MTILEFMSESPFTSIVFCWLFCQTIFKTYQLTVRALLSRKHGWPPEHCDADGDLKKEKTQ